MRPRPRRAAITPLLAFILRLAFFFHFQIERDDIVHSFPEVFLKPPDLLVQSDHLSGGGARTGFGPTRSARPETFLQGDF